MGTSRAVLQRNYRGRERAYEGENTLKKESRLTISNSEIIKKVLEERRLKLARNKTMLRKRHMSVLGGIGLSTCVLLYFFNDPLCLGKYCLKGLENIKPEPYSMCSLLGAARNEIKKATEDTNKEIHGDTQLSRKNTILEFCKSQPNVMHANEVNSRYLPRGPFYYCSVPKLGTTFLSAFFSKALQTVDIVRSSKLIKYNLKDVFSYINVGDPYSRVFSAYKDKLYKPDVKFWNVLGTDVVKTVRSNHKTNGGFDVTFKELVQYVVNYHEKGKALNPHLKPIHELCNPCSKHFDFISKKETLSDDLVDLFDILKNASIVKDDKRIAKIEQDLELRRKHGYSSVKRLFTAVRAYPNISAHKLFLRHWSMFHIGGYMLNKYELPFNESIIKTVSAKQYEEALITAVDNSEDYKDELRLQRHEALVQAYRSVPFKLMSRLREFVMTDCLLFSYDDKPASLFDRETFNDTITHVYMKGI